MASKANILLVGSGEVGTMAAYNLEAGGLSSVTAILRSNYDAVTQDGFTITSLDHGFVKGYKPTNSEPTVKLDKQFLTILVLNAVPKADKETPPFDFIVVTTKNVADVSPTVAELVAPAVTEGFTTIVLLQNGLNIEKPLVAAFPKNPVLSGVSLIGATETKPGIIIHDDKDRLIIGAFINNNIPLETSITAAKKFVNLYSASGKVSCEYNEDVGFVRWRKLVYNACWNSVCAVIRVDTSRMRMAKFPIDDVIRPLMLEVCAIAKAAGHELPEGIAEVMINADPEDTFFKPSMQQDIEKVFSNI